MNSITETTLLEPQHRSLRTATQFQAGLNWHEKTLSRNLAAATSHVRKPRLVVLPGRWLLQGPSCLFAL